ncbi:hypothetical protein MKX01_037205 [Papaver californicum]|nr:hypothetical protein MKX01_037205 [Papaver californicum]
MDVIGIDEAHFFDDLYDFCCKEADHDGKIVVVAVLDGDYLRKGLKSVVLERSDKLRTTGATIFIHSDRNALDQLGIGAQLGKLN